MVTSFLQAQTLQNPTFGTVTTKTSPTVTNDPYLTTTGTTGIQGKIAPVNLLIPYTPVNYSVPNLTIGAHLGGIDTRLGLKVNGTNASDFYRNIYYMGDSLTDDGTYIYVISSVLGNTWYNYNYGRSGDNTTGMLARFNTDILSKNNPSHVVILGGTNDVTNGTSAATIQANLQQMYTDAHNAGLTVIAVTITPRTTTAPQLAVQQAVNTWIKTVAINVDYVVDPYVTLADPSNPTQLLPAYNADGLHMTTAGYTALGNYIASNVTWVAKENNYNLKIDVKGYASANQNLNTNSNPIFNTINNITVGSGAGNVYTNTALGRQALNSNTYGRYNTGVGNQSLLNNTSGHSNVGLGHQSLQYNTTGFANIGIGYQSLNSNINGTNNVGVGISSLFSNTTGLSNIGIGSNTLRANQTSSNLIAIGSSSMFSATGSSNVVAVGVNTLQNNISGSNMVAIGTNALAANTTGNGNIGIGYLALGTNLVGGANIGIGQSSLFNTKGGLNVAIGSNSLIGNTTGSDNLALGVNAGAFLADGTTSLGISNTSLFLGGGTKALINNTSNEIVIGWNAIGIGSNSVILGNSAITKTALRGNILIGSTTDFGTGEKLQVTGTAKVTGITSLYVADIDSGYIGFSTNTSGVGINRPALFRQSDKLGLKGSITNNNSWLIDTNLLTSPRTVTVPDSDGTLAVALNGSATLDFPSTGSNSESNLTISVPGAAVGDVISLGAPAIAANTMYLAFVSASNTVTVRFRNLTLAAIDPASATFKVKIFK